MICSIYLDYCVNRKALKLTLINWIEPYWIRTHVQSIFIEMRIISASYHPASTKKFFWNDRKSYNHLRSTMESSTEMRQLKNNWQHHTLRLHSSKYNFRLTGSRLFPIWSRTAEKLGNPTVLFLEVTVFLNKHGGLANFSSCKFLWTVFFIFHTEYNWQWLFINCCADALNI